MSEKIESNEDVKMEDVPAEQPEAQDTEMANEQQGEGEEEEEEEDYRDPEKIIKLPGASEDGTAASFQIKDEDHTLGNSLRYIIMKKYVNSFYKQDK